MKKFYLSGLFALFMTHLSVCGMAAEHNQQRTTGLHRAAGLGSTALIRFLLRHGANVNAQNRDGQTPLHKATEKGHVNTARILIEHGARVELGNDDGTMLHVAAKNDCPRLVEFFLQSGADVNAQNRYGHTPLHKATGKGHVNTARVLLECGALIDLGNDRGTVLHDAAKKGYTDIVGLLIAHGAEIDKGDWDGWTPLQLACLGGHLDVVRILVQAGADANTFHVGTKFICMRSAAGSGNPELVEFLIKHGAAVDELDYEGSTPLFNVFVRILGNVNVEANIKIAKLLIQNGADVNRPENMLFKPSGVTLLEVAAETGNYRCAEILVLHGADIPRYIVSAIRTCSHIDNQARSTVEFCTRSSFRGEDVAPSMYRFPILNEYAKIIILLLSFDARYCMSDLQGIRQLFPRIDIVKKAQEAKEARTYAIKAVLPEDLPEDLVNLIVAFAYHRV